MTKHQINVGGLYRAKVNGKLTTVRVDRIYTRSGVNRDTTGYDVTNLSTGRATTFRSAQKFLREAPTSAGPQPAKQGGEQRPDPIATSAPTPSPTPKTQPVKPTADTAAAASTPPSSPASSATSVLAGRKLPTANGRPPHVVVLARAGTGKTTTLVEGLKLLRGQEPRITPSEQQRAVWDQIALSVNRCKFVCLTAFNVKIAEELRQRVPERVDVSTVHGLGMKSVRRAFGDVDVENRRARTKALLARVTGRSAQDLETTFPRITSLVDEIVSKCKMNLVGLDALRRKGECDWDRELDAICDRYGIEFGDRYADDREAADRLRRAVYDLVPRVLGESLNLSDKRISYDDMIWLPVALDLPSFRFDLLLVDEAQDLNRCQQALVRRIGERLILVGDDRQAIYGFAGADSESIPRMVKELGGVNPRDRSEGGDYRVGSETRTAGCVVLPLTVTRRCGRKIVDEARKYVADFSAHESNPEGVVRFAPYWRTPSGKVDEAKSYLPDVRETDMILSRANAPLVANCLKLLKRGTRAHVVGREVGDGIVSLIVGMEATSVPELVTRLKEWATREKDRLAAGEDEPDQAKLDAISDRLECALAFAEDAESVQQVVRRVDEIFTDSERPGAKLSSIHKAKGLEASRVYWLQPGGLRGRRSREADWEWQQELNLRYVAITRAIDELVIVS